MVFMFCLFWQAHYMMNIIRFFLSYGNSQLIQKKSGLFHWCRCDIWGVLSLTFRYRKVLKKGSVAGSEHLDFCPWNFLIITIVKMMLKMQDVRSHNVHAHYHYHDRHHHHHHHHHHHQIHKATVTFLWATELAQQTLPSSPHSATLTNQSQYVRFQVNHDQIELEFLGGSSTQSMNISSLHVEFPGVLWNITIHDSHGGIDPTEMFVNFYLSPVSFSLKKGSSRWTRSISSRWLR